MVIGIIGAMEKEVAGLIPALSNSQATTIAGLTFYHGKLGQNSVVIVQCGVGKVNAALCTQILIDHFKINAVINTGIAGGIDPKVAIGDIVIATTALQHDVNATAVGYQPGQIPGLGQLSFPADPTLQEAAKKATTEVVGSAKTHLGIIATGDEFIASSERKDYLFTTFNALCAEMEGAAIAQVAFLNQLPYSIIRIMSDQADNSAMIDINLFADEVIPSLNEIVIKMIKAYSVCSKR